MFTSLRARLILSYIVIILICLALVSAASILLLSRFQAKLVFSGLVDAAVPTALRVNSLLQQDRSPVEIAALLQEQAERQQVRILLLTLRGQILADTQGSWTGKQAKISLDEIPRDPKTSYVHGSLTIPSGETQLYVALPAVPLRLVGENSETQRAVFVALLASPRRGLRAVLEDVASRFLLAGLITLAISLLIALLIARSITKPLRRMTAAIEEIARGNYDQTLDITSPDEVSRLAASFNAMVHEVKTSRQTQRDFVANVSHELKTPLTSIQGFSQAILDGTADDEADRYRAVEIIGEEAKRMSRLVAELLDLTRIESGQIEMLREPVDLTEVLEACVEKFALQARESNVELVLDREDTLPLVIGDEDRLAQVFTNLLANALKHTPPTGKVTVKGQTVQRSPKKNGSAPTVQVIVTDTGAGIPPEDLPHIFERFYQVDKSRAGQDRGAGLGLTIAKQIVEAHGGTITVDSVEGLGTKFTVNLPIVEKSY